MENAISGMLVIIACQLYYILKELTRGNDIAQRTWQGLFNDPNGGLSTLVYLRYIHDELKKVEKVKK